MKTKKTIAIKSLLAISLLSISLTSMSIVKMPKIEAPKTFKSPLLEKKHNKLYKLAKHVDQYYRKDLTLKRLKNPNKPDYLIKTEIILINHKNKTVKDQINLLLTDMNVNSHINLLLTDMYFRYSFSMRIDREKKARKKNIKKLKDKIQKQNKEFPEKETLPFNTLSKKLESIKLLTDYITDERKTRATVIDEDIITTSNKLNKMLPENKWHKIIRDKVDELSAEL